MNLQLSKSLSFALVREAWILEKKNWQIKKTCKAQLLLITSYGGTLRSLRFWFSSIVLLIVNWKKNCLCLVSTQVCYLMCISNKSYATYCHKNKYTFLVTSDYDVCFLFCSIVLWNVGVFSLADVFYSLGFVGLWPVALFILFNCFEKCYDLHISILKSTLLWIYSAVDFLWGLYSNCMVNTYLKPEWRFLQKLSCESGVYLGHLLLSHIAGIFEVRNQGSGERSLGHW